MGIARTKLVQHRMASLTPDPAEALRVLEKRAAEHDNVQIKFEGTSKAQHAWANLKSMMGPTQCKPPWSMVPSGREVYLSLLLGEDELDEETRAERELATLWALAIPCGFVPWLRYPLPGRGDNVFHYLGPWQVLYDNLLALGRGEEAWPSVACAAQCDVGSWEGNHPLERFAQSQLHRIGVNVGPMDGRVGPTTHTGLQRAGLVDLPLSKAAEKLVAMQLPRDRRQERRNTGHLVAPGQNLSIVVSGQVAAQRTTSGATLTIDGPGRLVVDFA